MIYGLDEYYDGLLLEAKSEEEIKKILEYQFVQGKGVPQEVLDYVFSVDPTKKKSFTKWTLMQWGKDAESIKEAIKSKRLPKLFQYFQERAGSGLALNAMPSFDAAMEKLPEEDPILGQKPEGPAGNFEFVYDTPEWKIAVPHSYEADKFLGQGCRWCTAGAFGDNDQWWNRYSPKGPIWVNFDMRQGETCPMDSKEYPYTRYQFLFEWDYPKGELMDSRDKEVNFEEMDMPEEVKDFYEEQDPKYRERIDNSEDYDDPETRYEDYMEERWEHSHCILCIDQERYLSIMPEEDENYRFDENCYYYVYDEEDTSDPICWSSVDPENAVVLSYDDRLPIVIVKDNRGDLHAFTWESNGDRWRGGVFKEDGILLYKDLGNFCLVYSNNDEQIKIYGIGGLETAIDSETEPDDVRLIDLDASGVEGYENGQWLQLDYNKHSSLFYINPYGEPECVVKKDIPLGVDFNFTIGTDGNGNAYIQGKYSKHWLVDEDDAGFEREMRSFDIEEGLDGYVYIVEFRDGKKNIYDREVGRFLLKDNANAISEWGRDLVEICVDEGRYFYNYKTCEMVLPLANNYSRRGDIWIGHYKDYIELYLFNDEDKAVNIGKFASFAKELDREHFLFTAKDGMMRVVSSDGNIDDFPIARYGEIEYPLVYATQSKEEDPEVVIYNYVDHKIVFRNSAVWRTNAFLSRGGKKYVPVKNKEGYVNILFGDSLLLKENAYKDIKVRTNCPMVIAITNDRYFFFDIVEMKTLYPLKGIDKNKMTLAGGYGNDYFYNNSEVKFTFEGHNMCYNPYSQDVLPMSMLYNTRPEEKEALIQRFKEAANDEVPQVAESFKNIYKRIIDARNKTL